MSNRENSQLKKQINGLAVEVRESKRKCDEMAEKKNSQEARMEKSEEEANKKKVKHDKLASAAKSVLQVGLSGIQDKLAEIKTSNNADPFIREAVSAIQTHVTNSKKKLEEQVGPTRD